MNLLSSTFKVRLPATSGAGNLLTVTETFLAFARYLSVSLMLTVTLSLPPIKPVTVSPETLATVVFNETYSNSPSLLVKATILTVPLTSTTRLAFSIVIVDANLFTVTVTFVEFERNLSVSLTLTVTLAFPPINPVTVSPETLATVAFNETYSNSPSLLVKATILTVPSTSTTRLAFSTVIVEANLLTVTVMFVSFAMYLSFPSKINVTFTLPPLRPVTLPVVALTVAMDSSQLTKRKVPSVTVAVIVFSSSTSRVRF